MSAPDELPGCDARLAADENTGGAAGLGDADREAAKRIRAALGLATEKPVDDATRKSGLGYQPRGWHPGLHCWAAAGMTSYSSLDPGARSRRENEP